jgi:hypothetical protein
LDILERRLYKGASEIDEVFGVVSSIVFGPSFDWNISSLAEDRMVMKITGCPLLEEANRKGRDLEELSKTCQTYCRSAVENLNPKCSQVYTRKMCSGDGYCENVISIRG